ncbi:Fe-S cluster assembly protein SufD [Microterricola pindariensis]|nr:Fe-S cluster assembly protein SufD [Microterricola pindariensis]
MPSSDAPAASLVSPEQHGLKKHSDGGWGLAPVQTRSARFASFEHSDFPVITGREAVWKLSPIAKFADLLDGELDGSAFPYTATDAAGVSISWIDRTDPRIGTAGKPEERASANAWTSFEKALLIRITGEDATEVTVLRDALGTAARAAHIVIEAAPFSNARIVLDNTGDARIVENVEIIVGESANLSMITVQQWNDGAVHLANHFSRVGRDAKLKHIVVSLGGSVVRLNPTTHLAESGADVEAYGLYFADAGQHLEQQVYVHHEAPHTRSRVNYKGALQGEGARTVWIGDVLIGQQATGTDSYEQNRNLVLSEGTRADSIPNLEIETGDIAGAGHASATGRFDDEQLFYLQSRGIPEEEARRLVVRGFLSEIVQQIGSAPLEERLQAVLEAELVGTAL